MNLNLWAKLALGCVVILTVSSLPAAQDRDALLAKINATKAFLLKQRGAAGYRESIRKGVFAYESNVDGDCKNVDLDFDSVDVKDRLAKAQSQTGNVEE